MKLEQSLLVNNDLKKQLEEKDEILRSKNEEKEQMQTTINELTNTVNAVNHTVQQLCGHIKDVSTCKIEDVSSFTEVPYSVRDVTFWSNRNVSVKCSIAIIRVAFGNGLMSLALCVQSSVMVLSRLCV